MINVLTNQGFSSVCILYIKERVNLFTKDVAAVGGHGPGPGPIEIFLFILTSLRIWMAAGRPSVLAALMRLTCWTRDDVISLRHFCWNIWIFSTQN
jgi:hypothetical protein